MLRVGEVQEELILLCVSVRTDVILGVVWVRKEVILGVDSVHKNVNLAKTWFWAWILSVKNRKLHCRESFTDKPTAEKTIKCHPPRLGGGGGCVECVKKWT